MIDIGVFDHLLVSWTVDISSPSPKYITISRCSWKSFDINEFQNEIAKSELCVFPGMATNTGTDVDGLADQFNTIMTSLLDKLAPFRPITVRRRVHHPWFNDESRDTRRKVHLLGRRFSTDNTSASCDE